MPEVVIPEMQMIISGFVGKALYQPFGLGRNAL